MPTKKLTEVEEKLFAWAQLSGLTAKDLVRIGGKFVREEKIAKEKQLINETVSKFVWSKHESGWLLHDAVDCRDRSVFSVSIQPGSCSQWAIETYHLILLDNCLRVQSKVIKFVNRPYHLANYPKTIFPDRSRALYQAMFFILENGFTKYESWPKISTKPATRKKKEKFSF